MVKSSSRWDFKQIPEEEFRQLEANAGLSGGFVFVDLDPACDPLRDYLELPPAHLDDFHFENRYKAVHVSMAVGFDWRCA